MSCTYAHGKHKKHVQLYIKTVLLHTEHMLVLLVIVIIREPIIPCLHQNLLMNVIWNPLSNKPRYCDIQFPVRFAYKYRMTITILYNGREVNVDPAKYVVTLSITIRILVIKIK